MVSRTVEVHVYDQQTEIGDTALLRCVYPSELRSYVRVAGWLSDDGLIILPPATSTADPYCKYFLNKSILFFKNTKKNKNQFLIYNYVQYGNFSMDMFKIKVHCTSVF